MFFKNLLLGLGGIAAIGGIGYGIYSSSQSNDEEKTTTDEQKEGKDNNGATGLEIDSGHDNENSAQREENTDRNNAADLRTGEVDGKKGEKASSAGGTKTVTKPAA